MSKSIYRVLEDRIKTLKRRRDFLDLRIRDYVGSNDSRDKAEASALHWAIGVIEANSDSAYDLIKLEQEVAPQSDTTNKEGK